MTYRLSELEVLPDDPFKQDALQRKPIVEFLANLVAKIDGPFVLALDSPWGTGKTTLVRMLKAQLEQQSFYCIYFNAWKCDYATDPLVALVESIERSIKVESVIPDNFDERFNKVKKITGKIARRMIVAGGKILSLGILDFDKDIEGIISDVAADTTGDIVDLFSKERDHLEQFRQVLTESVEALTATRNRRNIIIFLDELDRCRPIFSIGLLERIKHLFDTPNIIFVLSVDKQQLECTIGAVYGTGTNSREYLRRFIDLEYRIPRPVPKSFTESLLTKYGLDELFALRNSPETKSDRMHFVDFFTLLADIFDLSLRARERCITRLRVVMDQTRADQYLDPIPLALLIVLRSNNSDLFYRLVNGGMGAEEVMNYIYQLPSGAKLQSEHAGYVIEAVLLAADKSKDRVHARIESLKILVADPNRTEDEKENANNVLRLYNHFANSMRSLRLEFIAAKVELSEMIR